MARAAFPRLPFGDGFPSTSREMTVMPTSIDLAQLHELAAAGAQLVEVLPEHEYTEEHLPAAINIPLKRLTARSVAVLDPARPVVVYCWDAL